MTLSDHPRPSAAGAGATPLYPASIAFLVEERPLLWYEDPAEYDALRAALFEQWMPEGALNCIFVKNVADVFWELRRMKRLTHTAINYAMPEAAANLLAPERGFLPNPELGLVRDQATDVAYGAEERPRSGMPTIAERMEALRVTPEIIHYKALDAADERLDWIRRECERLESRFHRLVKDYEARNATLAAMARSLFEREKADTVSFTEIN